MRNLNASLVPQSSLVFLIVYLVANGSLHRTGFADFTEQPKAPKSGTSKSGSSETPNPPSASPDTKGMPVHSSALEARISRIERELSGIARDLQTQATALSSESKAKTMERIQALSKELETALKELGTTSESQAAALRLRTGAFLKELGQSLQGTATDKAESN